MTRDDVIRMAREAGCCSAEFWPDDFTGLMRTFERFAALVAAAEREACATICECEIAAWADNRGLSACADYIRARSTT